MTVAVFGAGGFIGGHLVADLREKCDSKDILAVDVKPKSYWYQHFSDTRSWVADMSIRENSDLLDGVSVVYNLAADMGGMGFIETHKAECMLSVLINTHMLQAARRYGVDSYFFASSACVYAADKQTDPNVTALKEEDAYPAMPEDGYGWEKLFSERMCRHFTEDYGLRTRIARFHNVYGPNGTYDGGREKAPAAICRKVIEAKLSGDHSIEIWGDGEQTRSFMYIDDCIEGIHRINESHVEDPINLGSSELVSINQLVTMVEIIAGVELKRNYNTTAPQGVRGRNSDNEMIVRELGWEPSTHLIIGMEKTYAWIWDQMKEKHGI